MQVEGRHQRTIARADDGWAVEVVDQRRLPHDFVVARLESLEDAAVAIREMWVRGAPLIGVTAAYGLALALRDDASDEHVAHAIALLRATRPTGVNLRWAMDRAAATLAPLEAGARPDAAYALADRIADEDVATCESIGRHGLDIIRTLYAEADEERPVQLLTHCNAGWLATVDWGTALAPIYMAHDEGIPVHVWVDETRPRNQGAALTAWELGSHGVDHTVVVDNAGGHLMQRGLVDAVITGTDRTTAHGGVFNKIGTYLKALAAHDNDVPFYVALPGTTIDWTTTSAPEVVPIEERATAEVTTITGLAEGVGPTTVRLTPTGSPAANPAFDYTPARLVTGLITERGLCEASAEGLAGLYPEHAR